MGEKGGIAMVGFVERREEERRGGEGRGQGGALSSILHLFILYYKTHTRNQGTIASKYSIFHRA